MRENPHFLGFFFYFSNECTIFLANATCNSSMSFWRLDYCLTKFLRKKIDFSLEVHKTEISQMDLLSTMRQCDHPLQHFLMFLLLHLLVVTLEVGVKNLCTEEIWRHQAWSQFPIVAYCLDCWNQMSVYLPVLWLRWGLSFSLILLWQKHLDNVFSQKPEEVTFTKSAKF